MDSLHAEPQGERQKPRYSNIPQNVIEIARKVERVTFDPVKHLRFEDPAKITTLEEFGKGDVGISRNALTDPFSLFTEEAIQQMRAEIFSQAILEKYYCPTSPTSGLTRGHCPKDASFIYAAWTCPEVLEIVSKVAGVELIPAVDYDIGHVNLSFTSTGEETGIPPGEANSEATEFCESAFGWHTDSFPFVCVTMLSDCTNMVGGGTAIRTTNGQVLKARGPTLGTAVVMQGRHIEHQATPAVGGPERISMVTSFRPKSPLIKDETMLRGIRNISNTSVLYMQYTEYKLDNLEDRVRDELRKLRKVKEAESGFDVGQIRDWLVEQKAFIDNMLLEVH
ncbi:hypothetical protein K431DRAFT_230103 [Polychaeton citri CBS 116435]|uniref:Fe2OG dioxygenase domain-containing protein n=1 Tax=Polychaeton citri CBS 116435 TaxID=1314669 RepID=A0A9P4Q3L7_9PEZI|nr:hypothetical protein K431DRAFT_230103 [Polychaeton citri CBS 116435]